MVRRRSAVRVPSRGASFLRRPSVAALLLWALGGTAATHQAGIAPQSAVPIVVVGEYDGIIHPVAAEFVADLVGAAARREAAAVVLVLRTPGGLLESTRTIVSQMIASPVPVVVFVSPAGSRAASAGFLITIAADVAAMSPGTHIGAAHPVSADGRPAATEGDDVMAKKAVEDTAAYARTLAEARRRNVTLAAAAVTDSRAFTEREALSATPPLIDLAADDVPGLLRQLDGRTVTRFDGRTATLRTAGADVVAVTPTWRQRALSAIAHPQVAYLLFTLGMIGLMVEFWNPGLVLPGVAGGLSLLLAFFAFQILPVDVAGLLLVLFGLALLGAEVLTPSFGVLGMGGIAALLAGSLMITREVPGVHVSLNVILPVVGAAAVVVVGLGRLGYSAQRLRAAGGMADLVGAPAEALTPLGPDGAGQIRVRGEIWRAVSERPLPAGQRLRVVEVSGLTARVRAQDDHPPAGGPP
jgi:membrane-bound serine protease (ClpP class)